MLTTVYVRFGSLADPLTNISVMSASGGKADIDDAANSIHELQCDIRRQTKYDDCNLVLRDILKIRTGQIHGFQPKHLAMQPGYGSTHRDDCDRRNGQQYEIDDRGPTEECSYCF